MSTYSELKGSTVYDSHHQKIGSLDEFYVDEDTQLPTWMTVKTGLFGARSSFVPLALAQETDDGLEVAVTKDKVKDAPRIEADGRIDRDEEGRLLEYYRAVFGEDASESAGKQSDKERKTDTSDKPHSKSKRGSITRSEEELTVEKKRREVGKVRLHKYVTTENVNFTVPLKKEHVRLVQEPIEGSGEEGEIGESTRNITLHEEEVKVGKKVVPKERLRLEKDVVKENRAVKETLRKEQVDIRGDGEDGRKRK